MDSLCMDSVKSMMDSSCKQQEIFRREKNYFIIMVNGPINTF